MTVSIFPRSGSLARVNILRRVKTSKSLKRNARSRVQWPSGGFLIEWREGGRRLRASVGETTADALEAQKLKRLRTRNIRDRGGGPAPACRGHPKLPQGHQDVQQAPHSPEVRSHRART